LGAVYLVLALHADGTHRRCYFGAAVLYVALALVKLI
jgi:hypothetical protein